MKKTIKKIVISSLSILGISTLTWIILLLNPNMVYSNSTTIDNVTIYHQLELDPETSAVLTNALKIIRSSDIYDPEIEIDLCLNDHSFYPSLYPFAGATAYAFLDKTVFYNSTPRFDKNIAEFTWPINNNETRKYNLTYLIAHEFMHNVQHHYDSRYQIKSTVGKINWKLEGHADYIARQFKNDGRLKEKITKYLFEKDKEHVGVPVLSYEDGTIQNLFYYKYAVVIQYLFEERNLTFGEVCKLEEPLDQLFDEMIEWSRSE